jgi:hypothetical protein
MDGGEEMILSCRITMINTLLTRVNGVVVTAEDESWQQ